VCNNKPNRKRKTNDLTKHQFIKRFFLKKSWGIKRRSFQYKVLKNVPTCLKSNKEKRLGAAENIKKMSVFAKYLSYIQ